MKLNAKEDVEAPIDFVRSFLTDFDTWERAAMRRGAQVERLDNLRAPGPGMAWRAAFDYRAKRRVIDIKVLSLDAETGLAFEGTAKPAEGTLLLELTEMGARRTRLNVVMEVKPRTLAARLVLQSLKLAKAKVLRRFSQRLKLVAADIEDRFRAQG
jgi:carbon monoxide dehydrogenase subunit G